MYILVSTCENLCRVANLARVTNHMATAAPLRYHVDQLAKRDVKGQRVPSGKDELHQQTEQIVRCYIMSTHDPTVRQGHRYSAIQRSCAKVAKDNEGKFSELCERLKPTKESLHSNFVKVFGSLFSDGITVGKIIVSIAFGGRLITYCTEKGLNVTDNLTAWILDYFKNYLNDWILIQGGWVR